MSNEPFHKILFYVFLQDKEFLVGHTIEWAERRGEIRFLRNQVVVGPMWWQFLGFPLFENMEKLVKTLRYQEAGVFGAFAGVGVLGDSEFQSTAEVSQPASMLHSPP